VRAREILIALALLAYFGPKGRRERIMPCRRCSDCGANWPPADLVVGEQVFSYSRCPECDGPVWATDNGAAMPHAEAIQRSKAAAFERYYAAWQERQAREVAELEQAVALSDEALPKGPTTA
jgi:NAD-dependent SIR2 family protein deacetylase